MRKYESTASRCLKRLEKSIVSARSLAADGMRSATQIDGNSFRDYAKADYIRYELIGKEIEKFRAALTHLEKETKKELSSRA